MADVTPVPEIKPISRLLIANRGEIARRIQRTAHGMGISTVAVHADGDAGAPFVQEAGSAFALQGETARETYLDIDKIVDACKQTGADAVHPGYGFLSENAAFAQAVLDAGIAWVGPAPDVIAQMGDKLAAKRLMRAAGVATLEGMALDAEADPEAIAETLGYPVLVKAAAGGGGRGMRVVRTPAELAPAIAGARREAAAAFADGTLFLEKWLDRARHVEVQILGDLHGNLLHCFERECSIQRRHQKVIEEAPSPAVGSALRAALTDAALAAGRKLGYASAGTVEFLVQDEDFYFLEVNARLQVEHPVTEAIIGVDLVREQIRIAEGEPISFTQSDLRIQGAAIEARLYAENPEQGFLPSPGHVAIWRPASHGQTRFDSGVESGSDISIHFDALIAKVIAQAPSRREAALKLARALETTHIHGLVTNRDFLAACLRTPAFLAGDTTTDFIKRVNPARRRAVTRSEWVAAAIAIALEAQARRRASTRIGRGLPSGWRNSTMPWQRLDFDTGSETLRLRYQHRRDGVFEMQADADDIILATPLQCGEGHVSVMLDNRRLSFAVDRRDNAWFVQDELGGISLRELPRYPDAESGLANGGLTAPMPGSVLSIPVQAGETVHKGQLLLVLEAMKMEHRITAPADGEVEAVHVRTGEQVAHGALLVTIGAGATV